MHNKKGMCFSIKNKQETAFWQKFISKAHANPVSHFLTNLVYLPTLIVQYNLFMSKVSLLMWKFMIYSFFVETIHTLLSERFCCSNLPFDTILGVTISLSPSITCKFKVVSKNQRQHDKQRRTDKIYWELCHEPLSQELINARFWYYLQYCISS